MNHMSTDTWTGSLLEIFTAPAATAPMVSLPESHAVPGRGLDGDRYASLAGTFSKGHEADAELTLISIEAIEAVAREHSLTVSTAEPRRNLVTRGVPLNDLVGREFMIGDVRILGHGLCEPCAHLDALMGHRDVITAFLHRGGLRAQIISDGVLRVGDTIRPL
jgi:MOSC domain-containing protein YiiM